MAVALPPARLRVLPISDAPGRVGQAEAFWRGTGVVQHRPSSLPAHTRHRSSSAAQPAHAPSSNRDSGVTVQGRRLTMPAVLPPTSLGVLGLVDGLTDLGAPGRVG